jgi:pyrroline-5-carboxylate reductase
VPLRLARSLVGSGPDLYRVVVAPGIVPNEVMVALAYEPGTAPEQVAAVRAALEAVGTVQTMSEEALDAVAAVALGGPAFLCAALEGMEEAAVAEGLPRATARAFVHQTALATALLLCGHPGSPADLKDQVASPGGTTIVALAALEDAGVRGAYLRAVHRAAAGLRQRRDAAASSVLE